MCQRGDVIRRDRDAILVAQQVFQKNLQRHRHPAHSNAERFRERRNAIKLSAVRKAAKSAKRITHGSLLSHSRVPRDFDEAVLDFLDLRKTHQLVQVFEIHQQIWTVDDATFF